MNGILILVLSVALGQFPDSALHEREAAFAELAPECAAEYDRGLREFRKASQGVTQEIRESVIDPPEEAQKPLREAMEPIEELQNDLKADVKSVEKEFKDIGKAKPETTQEKPGGNET